ncbi:MAG: RNA polymerase subunit sigma-24 [Opitutus sp.]|nr:RNA polymerase subunit sigma-24 [Opitutus sp.]
MADDLPPERRDFAGLYRTTVGPLRRYLSRLLRDESEAEDIAHDAFLRVMAVVERDAAQKPAALLYTTARRLAINRIKRREHGPVARDGFILDHSASPQPGVPQQVMARQELERLEAAITRLPEGCRAVLLLRKVELLSHQEIADRLGIAVSTVEKQHARALRLLRAALSATPEQHQSPHDPEGAP